MNTARKYLETTDFRDLQRMWREIDEWEASGTLPEDARLRAVTDLVFGSPRGLLGLQLVATEVWRENAVRLLGCGPTDG